jgi:hypothetical protein
MAVARFFGFYRGQRTIKRKQAIMAKESKTADELRDMIMERARKSPICPPGMSVHIRKIRASWGIDCIPPTIKKSAHADCYDLLALIAAELRNEYDLASNEIESQTEISL